jgi:two-component system chemotaxis response regulator CheY
MDKRVLLVEDDLDLRDIVQDILETEGYDVIPAAHGRQALEYLRTTRSGDDAPALVILDLTMPMVSGWEVLDAILDDPCLQMPVIVVSAFGHSKPNGVAAYLRKPFNPVDLLDAVRGAQCEPHREERERAVPEGWLMTITFDGEDY